ncbi:hypothetical protein [Hymenobacter psychrophilus]|uniref:Uncharacterized protein n=1 Tax=Hymenobacter psychrophilus TaxID=651662 RepID=A0A1H3EKT6_9BACT|nr:hypothetical protein [Hymenobacter psychrophilus]SDX79393.1 hypothetical protein SAMN04488069_103197 [Hymenobacter psychrophilus]
MHTSLRFYAATAPLCALLALTACSKRNDAIPQQPVLASWTMDGQERTSTNTRAETSFDKVDVYIYQNFMTPNSNGTEVTVSLYIPKQIGTYTIGPNSQARANFIDLDTSTGVNKESYTAEAGSITISTLTATSVSGTFTLTGTGYLNKQLTKSLTNGKFTAAL